MKINLKLHHRKKSSKFKFCSWIHNYTQFSDTWVLSRIEGKNNIMLIQKSSLRCNDF